MNRVDRNRCAIEPCARAAILLLGIVSACASPKAAEANATAKPKNAPEHQEGRSAESPSTHASAPFTDEFGEDLRDFESHGTNPYFVLEVGYVLDFAGQEKGKELHLVITVLPRPRRSPGSRRASSRSASRSAAS